MTGADWDAARGGKGGWVNLRLTARDEIASLLGHVPDDVISDVVAKLDAATNRLRDDRLRLVEVLDALSTIGDITLYVVKAGV